MIVTTNKWKYIPFRVVCGLFKIISNSATMQIYDNFWD